MGRELTPKEVLYNFDIEYDDLNLEKINIPQKEKFYNNIKTALEINKEGFNIYLMDSFSKDKLDNIMNFVKEVYKSREKPKDICYVVYDEEKNPKVLFLKNGMGKLLEEALKDMQEEYKDIIYKFYNDSCCKEKEKMIQYLYKKKNETISTLIEHAKNEGFDVKLTNSSFIFLPINNGEALTEGEYDNLDLINKKEIIDKVSKLKAEAEEILKNIREMEEKSNESILKIYKSYLKEKLDIIKRKCIIRLKCDENAKSYFKYFCNKLEEELLNIYSGNYDEDEERIIEVIEKYAINVIVDNSSNEFPLVFFEKDPNINNLIGTIEYENHNGTYITDLSLIKAGSILRANEGCLIIRVSDLLNNPGSYYYLKKSFLNEKIYLTYNRGYLELLSLKGIDPEPISISTKLILIGDYATYDILYYYDEDFKKVFKLKTEYNSILNINKDSKLELIKFTENIAKKNNLNTLSSGALKQLAKHLSRKAEDKNKMYFDEYEINRIMILSDKISKDHNRDFIDEKDISEVIYKKDFLERQCIDFYKEKKIIINLKDELVGSINALSVNSTPYINFGRPIRVTCVCHKGSGNIIDIQKESNMSGKIHGKSVNILKAYLNNLINPYTKLPVDFYISFEQIYDSLDGDSASAAEMLCIISALSRIPIKQNIALTGSINQFGEIQPIGSVNEKIEGFFNICKALDDVDEKGVLIPESNVGDLVLNSEVEEAIAKGRFKIYTMNRLEDAVEILMIKEKYNYGQVLAKMEEEISKFAETK